MTSIRDTLGNGPDNADRFLWGATATVCVGDLLHSTSLGGRLAEFTGRSVLVATREPLASALALIELDGLARRLVICPPDLSSDHLPRIVAQAGVDAIVSDSCLDEPPGLDIPLRATCNSVLIPAKGHCVERQPTEWVLLTSGTTGAPKSIAHSLAGLTAAINATPHGGVGVVWGTFYDIRRYGGLQIFLRAVMGRGSFVLSHPAESAGDYLSRLGAHGVTHVSGTPSHWRRALMSGQAREIAPRYVRLSGEIADQAILNALRAFYPNAGVGHAFASTEAGVGFEVNDGLEGFPASLLGARNDVEMKIEDGSLRIRSTRTAVCYLGDDRSVLTDDEGFVDTGDMVELRGDRYHFLGRRTGVINIGGLKVYPEEVEAVINRHPAVRMSLARSRKSPITGSLVVADIVLKEETGQSRSDSQVEDIKREVLRICLETLPQYKVPATIRVVQALDVAAAGKLSRHHA